jgi:hypothetical protein
MKTRKYPALRKGPRPQQEPLLSVEVRRGKPRVERIRRSFYSLRPGQVERWEKRAFQRLALRAWVRAQQIGDTPNWNQLAWRAMSENIFPVGIQISRAAQLLSRSWITRHDAPAQTQTQPQPQPATAVA